MSRVARHPSSGPIRASAVAFGIASLLAVGPSAWAHEPLWGETPVIFGPGVFHPEIRFGYMRVGDASKPGGSSHRAIEQEYGLQYGINRWVNVRLTVPVADLRLEQDLAGPGSGKSVSGLGDIVASAKYRFHLRQGTGLQVAHAAVLGWKLPTGADDEVGPDGSRLVPALQPGSGHHGLEIGYAFDRETLKDTFWCSAFTHRDLGGRFLVGEKTELDAAFGRWVVRPSTADDLGFNLAFGAHAEIVGSDRLEDGASAGNRHKVVGVQVTPIFTKGRTQIRLGVLIPVRKSGDEGETDYHYEVRASWEAFF